MKWKAFKYALPLILFLGAWRSFTATGLMVWLPVIYAFVVIPVIELMLRPDEGNMDEAEEEMAKKDDLYDWFLYIIVPLQFAMMFLFLNNITQPGLSPVDIGGRMMVMGLLCGIFGINVAHELGHRVRSSEQLLARTLLMTSLYMHFFIEHNRGHHKHVGTPHDPSTAPYGQSLYGFWLRSITGVYRTAWQIAGEEQARKGRSWWQNEMFRYHVIQLAFCTTIGLFFGWPALAYYLIAALTGILLLETVNYIEHYGLQRRQTGEGRFERALPEHSWNSNHIVGRLMLFELSRHSDHHYLASRKYQTLRHHADAPQLPTGYPGSMLLALVPPLWFYVINKRIKAYAAEGIIHQRAAAAPY